MNEKILKDDYVVVHSWMIDLFRPQEKKQRVTVDYQKVLIFAYIYSYSKDGNSKWYGQQKTLAEYVGMTEANICNKLKEMVEDGYIDKEEVQCFGMFHHNNYSVNQKYTLNNPVINKTTGVIDKITGVIDKTINNNTINITDYSIGTIVSKDTIGSKPYLETSKDTSPTTVFSDDLKSNSTSTPVIDKITVAETPKRKTRKDQLVEYVNSSHLSEETKQELLKWIFQIGLPGGLTIEQLDDKVSKIYSDCNGDEVKIRTAINNAYLSNWFAFYPPREYKSYNNNYSNNGTVDTLHPNKQVQSQSNDYASKLTYSNRFKVNQNEHVI